jgi:Flp pilus assembly protein TadG
MISQKQHLLCRRTFASVRKALVQDLGAAMIEATIVVSLLLLLTFGIIQFGLIFFVENTMQEAVRQSVRETSVGASVLEDAAAESGSRPSCLSVSTTVTVADFDKDGTTDNTAVSPAEWIACDFVSSIPGNFFVDGYQSGEEVTLELEVDLSSILLVNVFGLIAGSNIIVSETMALED